MKRWRAAAAGCTVGLAAISIFGCQSAGEKETEVSETTVSAAEEETDGVAEESQESMTMRVATWNVDSKAHPDIKKMSEIIKENGVEIMGFQEIDVNNTRNGYDMVQDFVNEDYPYVHFAKGRDFANGGFGVGITSKYELKEVSSIPVESTGSKATKVLERGVFEKDGREIAFYVTHTSWENTDLRRRQIAEIIERDEINQKDEEGNTISTHLASLNDNLNMSQEYREFDYNFTTSPYAASADIVLHVVAGEGSLYLDDVTVRQVIPTEVVFVEAESTELAAGGTTKAAAQIFPENANDLTFHWASSDESVLTVAEDGTVTAVGAGSAYVQYVNSEDLAAESSVLITVK